MEAMICLQTTYKFYGKTMIRTEITLSIYNTIY